MLRKLIVGLFIGMLAFGSVNAEEKTITYTVEKAIGYEDAVNGLTFSPSLTDMISKIGEVDAFDIAINKEKNPDAVILNNNLNYSDTRINLTDIQDNQVIQRDNIAMYSNNGVAYLRIFTNVPFTTRTIQTGNYKITYTVGNRYLYKVLVETKYQEDKYKEKFDRDRQKEYLTARTYNYLSNNGYKSLSIDDKKNKFIKDDLMVAVDTPEEVNNPNLSMPSQYFSVSITNERLMQDYKSGKKIAYNTAVNKAFNDFDRLMK